jgi:hypothetical protein
MRTAPGGPPGSLVPEWNFASAGGQQLNTPHPFNFSCELPIGELEWNMPSSRNFVFEAVEKTESQSAPRPSWGERVWVSVRVAGYLFLFLAVLISDRVWTRVSGSNEHSLDKLDSPE